MRPDQFADTKILKFPERIAEWVRTGTTWPLVVDFDMTNACNHNCPDCCTLQSVNRSCHYTYEEAIELLGQFWKGGTQAVSLAGGGEPMVNPDTLKVIRTIAKWGMSVGLITNGAVLPDGDAPHILRNYCEWIRISLDASNPQMYAKTHGDKANWDVTIANIRTLAQCKGRATLGVAIMTGDVTREGMRDAALLVRSLGADYVQYRPYNASLLDLGDEIRAIKAEMDTENFKVLATWPKYDRMADPRRSYKVCHAQHFCAVVSPDRKMWRCCHTKNREEPLGNLHQQTVAELLASEKRMGMAMRDISHDPMCIPLCRGHAINERLQQFLDASPYHAEFL